MKRQIRYLVTILALVLTTLAATAQTQTTHEVQRGETLEAVAQKYGISTETLLQANPDAADMFFTGMKLQIPAGRTTTQQAVGTSGNDNSQETTVSAQPRQAYSNSIPTATQEYAETTPIKKGMKYRRIIGATFYAGSFDDVESTGHYGLTVDMLNINNSLFGANITIASFNYGLVDEKNASDIMMFGPNISYEVTKNVILSLPAQATFAVTFGKDENGKDKTYKGWGWATSPRVYFQIGKCCINVGAFVNGGFKKGEKTECGFTAGIGYVL